MTKIIKKEKQKFVSTFLNVVERVGNLLPHPVTIFAIFAACALVISGIVSMMDLEVVNPVTKEIVKPVNLLSLHGLHLILAKAVKNFTGFAPLGVVLVAILGLGVAEHSGFMGTALRKLVMSAPRKLITPVIVFAGVMSNIGSDVGYVLLVPLGAVIFLALGRHPIAGLAAAFAGVSGGYSANLLLGMVDPLLAGLSQEAAHIIDPAYLVNPACNYYFMVASTFIITAIGTWITEKVVEPRLGKYEGDEKPQELKKLNADEKRGLTYSVIAAVIFVVLLLVGTVPESGFLRDPETHGLLRSPFMEGIVPIIFILFIVLGITYGLGARTIKSDSDVVKFMSKSISTMSLYIVLVFFAAQFVAYFKASNLGLIIALNGAIFLKSLGLGAVPLMIMLVLLSAFINMFMGSASAKWTIMAPVFVPMFMLVGYTPELVQAAYRIGDSTTNLISPMMSYFALIIAFVAKYKKNAGIGTVVATMLPYSISFLIAWAIFLGIWITFNLPLGPGAYLRLAG
jgi:aminobenzoyl-glutamate transport protein